MFKKGKGLRVYAIQQYHNDLKYIREEMINLQEQDTYDSLGSLFEIKGICNFTRPLNFCCCM